MATATNIFIGLLFLLSQPRPVLIRLVGGDAWAMALLALGILLGVAAAGLALLALGAKDPVRATWAQAGLVAATLVVMVLLRDQVRQIALRDVGFESPGRVAAQWGPFAVFVVLLVAAVATIGWMARVLARGRGAALLVLLAGWAGLAFASPVRAEEPTERRVESALAEARVAAKELSEAIRGLLMQELKAGGLERAVAVCSTKAQARTAEYRRTFKNDIRRVSLRRRNPANEPDAYERRALESFDLLPADARPAAEHWELVRDDGRETLRYLKPLVANAMCLTCHGEKAKIPPAVLAVISRDYPDDRATGFSVGDVRGAVSVRIPLVSAR